MLFCYIQGGGKFKAGSEFFLIKRANSNQQFLFQIFCQYGSVIKHNMWIVKHWMTHSLAHVTGDNQ